MDIRLSTQTERYYKVFYGGLEAERIRAQDERKLEPTTITGVAGGGGGGPGRGQDRTGQHTFGVIVPSYLLGGSSCGLLGPTLSQSARGGPYPGRRNPPLTSSLGSLQRVEDLISSDRPLDSL